MPNTAQIGSKTMEKLQVCLNRFNVRKKGQQINCWNKFSYTTKLSKFM